MGVKVSFLDPRAAAAPADEPRSRLLVPRAAVREEAGETRVWVVAEARVEDRVVELGARAGDRVQVLSGLAAGERVVVESSEELSEGQEVEDAGSGS
jgi:multidrug efflux pump subunit AcrA (membrane-fusion protein)